MELTLEQALQKGIEAHKAEQVQEADRLYTAILKVQPKHPDANHNMGVLAVDVGKVQEALPFFKTALEANPNTTQFWLSYIDALIKLDKLADAKAVLDQAKDKGAKGEGFDKLEQRLERVEPSETTISQNQDPSEDQLQPLINLYSQGQYQQTLDQASQLLQKFQNSAALHNICGVSNKMLWRYGAAIDSYKQALKINPSDADICYNMGICLKQKGDLDSAIETFKQALKINPYYADAFNDIGVILQEKGNPDAAIHSYKAAIKIKPDFAAAYNNMGNALENKGNLEAAIASYEEAIKIKPNFAEAYNNIGTTLEKKGEPDSAICNYKCALKIKHNYAEAYNNMGITLQNKGNLKAAMQAYKAALKIKPDYAHCHRNLSSLKKYVEEDSQLKLMDKLYKKKSISCDSRCQLCFALAKAHEDLNQIEKSYKYFNEGNALRKKILGYDLYHDKTLFSNFKKTQFIINKNAVKTVVNPDQPKPIFVLGMPRSGTSLVEQIISSHSEITGAGELSFVENFGGDIVQGLVKPNKDRLLKFRNSYLSELNKQANKKKLVVDKMPHNFQFIALICAAFPEAKIIHVQRDPKATCWSNYKHYFQVKALGYCYNLNDLVSYYSLYIDLMNFWQLHYGKRIYHLNYDQLTNYPDRETRQLVRYLNIEWDDACLLPQNNNRYIKTASQQQVRKEIYQGSSQKWLKFEPFVGNAFDKLADISETHVIFE